LREQLGRQDTEQRPYPYQTAEVSQFVGCGSGNFPTALQNLGAWTTNKKYSCMAYSQIGDLSISRWGWRNNGN
jgi:hypothetical protein